MREYFIWLAKFVTLVVVLLVAIPSLIIAVISASSKHMTTASGITTTGVNENKVAVVELHGVIEDSKEVLKELYKQAKNDKVKAIVLDINSPGGAVGPAQAIYHAVKKLKDKKPIVAKMGMVAASGGLYAALGASHVMCQPGTLTGSIGVILQIPNFTNIAKQVGFEMITVKSGALKDAGNAFRPFTETDREYFQSTIDVAYSDFVKAIVEGRELDKADVMKYADGRVVLGSQAVEYGLTDGYGDVYDAAAKALELAGSPLDEGEFATLVYKENKYEELRELFSSWLNFPAVMQSTPRLMYMMQ